MRRGLVSSDGLRVGLLGGEKFVILVSVFGDQTLQWIPEISVSRLDLLRLEDLQKMAIGSIEQKNIQAIKNRLPLSPVDPMAAHKSSR